MDSLYLRGDRHRGEIIYRSRTSLSTVAVDLLESEYIEIDFTDFEYSEFDLVDPEYVKIFGFEEVQVRVYQ